jgi:hypothetical protein
VWPGSFEAIIQSTIPYLSQTALFASESIGNEIPISAPSSRHASTGSGERLRSWIPRPLNASLFCRSTTCCMQPSQPGPMLKYSSTGEPR